VTNLSPLYLGLQILHASIHTHQLMTILQVSKLFEFVIIFFRFIENRTSRFPWNDYHELVYSNSLCVQ